MRTLAKRIKGRFAPYASTVHPGLFEVLRFAFHRMPFLWFRKVRYAPVRHLFDIPDRSQDCIIWLGHASFIVQIDGVRIAFDPVMGSIIGVKRGVAFPLVAEQFRDMDYVVLSHTHYDHCDKKTLQHLNQTSDNLKFIVSEGMAKVIEKFGIEHSSVTELSWHDDLVLTDTLTITCLPAQHWSRRGMFDMNTSLWSSFMIGSPKRNIYFAGDTAYADHFQEIAERFPEIDIALMPVGAYKPQFLMKPSHVSPKESVDGFHILGAKTFIPMHFGTLRNLSEDAYEDAVADLHDSGIEKEKLRILDIGEVYPVK